MRKIDFKNQEKMIHSKAKSRNLIGNIEISKGMYLSKMKKICKKPNKSKNSYFEIEKKQCSSSSSALNLSGIYKLNQTIGECTYLVIF